MRAALAWLAGVCWAIALAGAAVALRAQPGAVRAPGLRVVQLDVGQGDAALITTPEGRRILIDGGPDADAVAGLLRDAGVDTLDLVVASHNHADHIGGLPHVFATCAVRAYLENGLAQPTAVYRRLLDRVERAPGLRVLRATARTITVGSVRLRVLAPSAVDGSQNNNSVGVVVEYGQFRALFTGDSETRELAHWVAEGSVPRVTLVKVAHHGARNGTTAAWVRATQPAVAVVSVGAGNRYHHPSAAVERLWAAAPARVYRTDQDGAVEVTATADGAYAVHTHAMLAPVARAALVPAGVPAGAGAPAAPARP